MPMMASNQFSILSWNCLADCYAYGAFTGRIPNPDSILSWENRFKSIRTVLSERTADIICLQEVDHFTSHFLPYFAKENYQTEYLRRPGREDGVLIAFKRSKFGLRLRENVYFDDLATTYSSFIPFAHKKRLQKNNVAIILLLETADTDVHECSYQRKTIIVSTTHLFWNPVLPRVKLAQAHYLLERVANIRTNIGNLPCASILTGDFNSLPNSQTYASILNGIEIKHPARSSTKDIVQRALLLYWPYSSNTREVKFICDANLRRLARWFRLLGIDAALEDDESEGWRAKNDFTVLFNRARKEKRIIITTSTELVQRAACPEAYLLKLKPNKSLQDWLVSVLTFYKVPLDRGKFLSRCGKCGAFLELCPMNDPRLKDKKVPTDRDLFVCQGCTQVYWWGESKSSTSSKARNLAESLYLAVEKKRKALDRHDIITGCGDNQFGTLAENTSSFECTSKHRYKYRSAFVELKGKEPLYTNRNGSFLGTLDYIFTCGGVRVLDIGKYEQKPSVPWKNYFPNENWPSDHMLIRANISFKQVRNVLPLFPRSLSLPH